MSIQTNLKMIKLLLDDIRLGAKINSNDSKVLRYLVNNVHNTALHEKLDIAKDIDEPDFIYMSELFRETWKNAGSPSGNSALGKFGIREHHTPLNIIIRRMVVECTDEESIYKFLSENNRLVFITNEEDSKLNSAGYQRDLPPCGKDRYEAVGISIYPEPVLYKNYSKHRKQQ